MDNNLNVFKTLYKINVNDHTEQKDGLTYLSWPFAIAEVKKNFPDFTYTVHRFGESKLPYVYDDDTGYMVSTEVTIGGQTHEMWLPVMDGKNKAMKNHPYDYFVKDYKTGKNITKTVSPATMFDINKAIMRCLVKNLAMFGLGLYIYSGEDLPEVTLDDVLEQIAKASTPEHVKAIYNANPKLKANIFDAVVARGKELKNEIDKSKSKSNDNKEENQA